MNTKSTRLTADQRELLDQIMGRTYQTGSQKLRMKSYRQLSSGLITVLTTKQTFSFMPSEFNEFLEKVEKMCFVVEEKNPSDDEYIYQSFSSLEEELNQVIRETAGYEFRISLDGFETKCYIVRSKKIFKGSLKSILQWLIYELRNNRIENTNFTQKGSLRSGNQKQFVYYKNTI